MARQIRFFRNVCPHCNRVVGIPLLGNFSYGEFVYQTEDGTSFAYVLALNNPAWEKVETIFKKAAGMTLDQNNDDTRIYQNVLICCADTLDGKRYTVDFPLCSECGGKIDTYNDDEMLYDSEVAIAGWDRFLSCSDSDQTTSVLALIDEQRKG